MYRDPVVDRAVEDSRHVEVHRNGDGKPADRPVGVDASRNLGIGSCREHPAGSNHEPATRLAKRGGGRTAVGGDRVHVCDVNAM